MRWIRARWQAWLGVVLAFPTPTGVAIAAGIDHLAAAAIGVSGYLGCWLLLQAGFNGKRALIQSLREPADD